MLDLLLTCFTTQQDLLSLGMTFCTPEDYACMTQVVEMVCEIPYELTY